LIGSGGDDFLIGGGGRDTLSGYWGDDTYFFEPGFGRDRIIQQYQVDPPAEFPSPPDMGDDVRPIDPPEESMGSSSFEIEDGAPPGMPVLEWPGTDRVLFGAGITPDRLWFDRVGDDLRVIAGEGRDHLTIENWFRSESDRVDRFETQTGVRLVADEVQLLVQAMAAYSLGDDAVSVPQSAYDAMAPLIAETWHTA
jgi:Ca2+-binding RTX toxin-like protein